MGRLALNAPARLNALDKRVSNLYDRHVRALTAMQRADFHLARATRMLTHAITRRSRLTTNRNA